MTEPLRFPVLTGSSYLRFPSDQSHSPPPRLPRSPVPFVRIFASGTEPALLLSQNYVCIHPGAFSLGQHPGQHPSPALLGSANRWRCSVSAFLSARAWMRAPANSSSRERALLEKSGWLSVNLGVCTDSHTSPFFHQSGCVCDIKGKYRSYIVVFKKLALLILKRLHLF